MFYRLMIIFFGILMIFGIIGCETNKDLTLNIEKEYAVDYKSTLTSQDSVVIPSLTNSDFEKHKFDIESAELQNASYLITSLQAPAGKNIDSIKADSIKIRIGSIFGTKIVLFDTLKNIYLNNARTSRSLSLTVGTGKTTFEDLISKPPYSARIYADYFKPPDSTSYKIKLSFAFKVTYKEQTP